MPKKNKSKNTNCDRRSSSETCQSGKCQTKKLCQYIDVPITIKKTVWQRIKVPINLEILPPRCAKNKKKSESKRRSNSRCDDE